MGGGGHDWQDRELKKAEKVRKSLKSFTTEELEWEVNMRFEEGIQKKVEEFETQLREELKGEKS